ncbi:14 kDa zinc-binding protein [Heracleum sosnowskyi]|uniref:14 kDa zinc-binding protein n=1 Tax=Heracleum sosnowskyi TaxID=360622 RepID=A0AAD8IFA4_9APIA|nr:14 kDa zinc-binding protein [Heracleum sosnowskyi]
MAAVINPFSLLRYSLSLSLSLSFSLLRGPLRIGALATIRASKEGFFIPPAYSVLRIGPRFRRTLSSAGATNNEEAVAKVAADTGAPTIFDKIISKEIPSTIVYEDEKVLAFRDINPQAPVHVVVIPKYRDGLTQLGKAEERHGDILGHLLYAAKLVAEKEGIVDGFRVVINNGPAACQSVYHIHLHVLGGRQLKWPPG